MQQQLTHERWLLTLSPSGVTWMRNMSSRDLLFMQIMSEIGKTSKMSTWPRLKPLALKDEIL